MNQPYEIRFDAMTAIGSRQKNQDGFLINHFISQAGSEEQQVCTGVHDKSDELFVCAVADGIGMFERSEEAVALALKEIESAISAFPGEKPGESIADTLYHWCLDATLSAHKAVQQLNKTVRAGGCTIVLLAIFKGEYCVLNCGDSPAIAYDCSEKSFDELTVRHTAARLKSLLGQTPTEDEYHILLHYLGEHSPRFSLTFHKKRGTICKEISFILCTDGFDHEFTKLIPDAFDEAMETETPAATLVRKAADEEHADNCTAVILRFDETQSEEAKPGND